MKKIALLLMALLAGPVQAADAPPNAANLAMARRLVAQTGGVAVILRLYGEGQAASAAAPADFRTAFAQAMDENQAVIAAADEKLASTYARIYPTAAMAAELSFYDSPMGKAMVARYRNFLGQITWPDPGNSGLSPEETAALQAFNRDVKTLNAAAAASPTAMQDVLAAESDAIVTLRRAAYANYCRSRDCAKEGVVPSP